MIDPRNSTHGIAHLAQPNNSLSAEIKLGVSTAEEVPTLRKLYPERRARLALVR